MTQNSTAKGMAQAAAMIAPAMVGIIALMMIPQSDEQAWIAKLAASKAIAWAGLYVAYRLGRKWQWLPEIGKEGW